MIADLQIEKKHSYIVLGLTLRYARLKAGYSLRDLGELSNISHTLIANIETGKTIANAETLRDLFSILHIEYDDSDELIQEFTTIYNRTLTNLFYHHYDRTIDDIAYLEEHEERYLHSPVTIEFSLLRFLHGALTDNMTPNLNGNLDILNRLFTLLSSNHQQLKHLIFGINFYNQGLFYDAYHELHKGLQIGDARLEPLVGFYILRCQTKMYMFMDAQKNAESLIKKFDEVLNYKRSMQIRLELAYSHMLLRKNATSIYYIEKIELFGSEFHHQDLLDDCASIRATMFLLEENYEDMMKAVQNVVKDTALSIYAKMVDAYIHQDIERIQKLYDQYIQEIDRPNTTRLRTFFDVVMCQYRAIEFTEEEYINRLDELLEVGKRGHDQEVLNIAFDLLIEEYKKKRLYKKAFELSQTAREIRSYGFMSRNTISMVYGK